jgi:Zinc knuckle
MATGSGTVTISGSAGGVGSSGTTTSGGTSGGGAGRGSTSGTGGATGGGGPPGAGGPGGGGGGPGPPAGGGGGGAPGAAGAAQGQVPIPNGSMRGHPPEIFDGNRKNTNKFMKEFTLWKLCNMGNQGMANPFSRVALALSYMKGSNVDDWVSRKVDETFWKVYGDQTRVPPLLPTHLIDDELLWSDFAHDFLDAFGDTAVAERAHGELNRLELKGNKVDDYVALFERLIERAGWERTAHGSVEMFKGGIPRKLLFVILNRDQVPHTIGEWQRALRNEIQRREMIDATLGPRGFEPNFQRKGRFQPKEERRSQRRDPNAMDVDAAIMGTETKRSEGKLSEGEKKKRQAEGRCFTCGRQGHMSRACPKKREGEKAKNARKAEIKDQQQEEKEERESGASDPPPYDSQNLMAQIRAMSTDERDTFLDQMMMAEEDF